MSSPDTNSHDTNTTEKTPAQIELEDNLRSIRGVGESADGATAEESTAAESPIERVGHDERDEHDEPVS